MRVLGITVRRDAETNPMQLASAIVKTCGLTLASEQERVGKARGARTYHVDGAQAVLEHADAYLARLRRGEAFDEGVEEEPEPEVSLSAEAAAAILADLCAA